MISDMHCSYLDLGPASAQLVFDSEPSAAAACRHICAEPSPGSVVRHRIRYIPDDSIAAFAPEHCAPNVVGIWSGMLADGREARVLHVFGKHTFALCVAGPDVEVRYMNGAPIRLMLDDVLQAALQPVLDMERGFILHGSCLARDGRAVLLMGCSGSGKSVTALNLALAGFECYADDAALVSETDGMLNVCPFARELSVRPAAWRLFAEQDIETGVFRHEDGKYYFRPPRVGTRPARLDGVCFLEVGGETETEIMELDRAQTETVLGMEKRHFSFASRDSAAEYTKRMIACGLRAFNVRLGTDLHAQRAVLGRILDRERHGAIGRPVRPSNRPGDGGRSGKIAIVKRAWSDRTGGPLRETVSLLGDYDPNVYAVTLGFFQTYALARLNSVGQVSVGDMPAGFGPDWIRCAEWRAGCRVLADTCPVEMFRVLARGWLKSAPILFPFLFRSLDSGDERAHILETEWAGRGTAHASARSAPIRTWGPWSSGLADDCMAGNRNVSLFIRPEEPGPALDVLDRLADMGMDNEITFVPVISAGARSNIDIAFARRAVDGDVRPILSRIVPLCCLAERDAWFLLENNLLARHVECNDCGPGGPRVVERPFGECGVCEARALGLCAGAVVC